MLDNKKDARAIWEQINKWKNNNSITFPKVGVNLLNDFFALLCPNKVAYINSNGADFKWFVPHSINSFFLHNTDANEIIKVCRLLKLKLSSGYDQLPTESMSSIIDLISHPLAYLFNLSFSNGIFPSCFKIAKVIFLYKGGDTSKLINYRPISILPSLSKVLERIMYNRMVSFIDFQSILHFYQFGFCSHLGSGYTGCYRYIC